VITLNTEKGFVRVDAWSDVATRPGFIASLDPKKHNLKAIIGSYIFPDPIPCGLSNCHTPHLKGYLVSTEEGMETNIGRVCGKTHFNVEFEELTRQFDRALEVSEYRERLERFLAQLSVREATVKGLRHGPPKALEIFNTIRFLSDPTRGCPIQVVRHVGAMIKSRTSILERLRQADESEIAAEEVATRKELSRPHFVPERFGQLEGMIALYEENDIRRLLVNELEEKFKEFRELEIGSLTHASLRSWATWTDTVDLTIERLRDALDAGKALSRRRNLEQLLHLFEKQADSSEFRRFLNNLEAPKA